MANNITVDFFRVRIDDTNIRFDALLSQIAALADRTRNLNFHGDVLRLQELHHSHQSREGEMTRIRLSDLPSKVSLEGEIAAIDLDEDEGLGENAAFIYHPATQVLALQRNRNSLTARNFAYYVSEKGGSDEIIYFDPVLQEDAIRRLAGLRVIRRFEVRFARVNNAEVFRRSGAGTREMIDVLDYFSAPTADFELSMGRRRGTLPLDRVKTTARSLFSVNAREAQNEVQRIELAGIDEDGEKDVFDLVKFKMVEVVSVTGEGRRLPYRARREAMRQAFTRRQDELGRMFRAEE